MVTGKKRIRWILWMMRYNLYLEERWLDYQITEVTFRIRVFAKCAEILRKKQNENNNRSKR